MNSETIGIHVTCHCAACEELLTDAICGVSVHDISLCNYLQAKGLMAFTGNQWNENWDWRRASVEALPFSNKVKLYEELKKHREEQKQKARELRMSSRRDRSTKQ